MGVSPIRQSKDCLFLLSKVFWFVKYKTCLIEVYRCYKLASEGDGTSSIFLFKQKEFLNKYYSEREKEK